MPAPGCTSKSSVASPMSAPPMVVLSVVVVKRRVVVSCCGAAAGAAALGVVVACGGVAALCGAADAASGDDGLLDAPLPAAPPLSALDPAPRRIRSAAVELPPSAPRAARAAGALDRCARSCTCD